jgi:ribosomal-protein-alanine N-acetyltransferase
VTLLIRPAAPNDAAALAALHARCFGQPWPAAAIATLLRDPAGVAWLALAGSEPAGFALARIAADEAEILTIAVAPDHRRRGLATRLLAETIAAISARGAAKLFLEVSESAAPARALYAALGCRETGRRPRYYEDGADALLLRLDLDGSVTVDAP